MRYASILLSTAVSIVGCALVTPTAEAAHRGVARPAAVLTGAAHDHGSSIGGCPRSPGRVCQASVRSPHTGARPHRRPRGRPDSSKSNSAAKTLAAAGGRAAVIAAVLATQCENTGLTPEAGNLPLVRAAVLCLVNKERAQNGESPLTLSPQLEQAAEGHSGELVSADYFAHVSPGGMTPMDRVRDAGYIPGPSVGYVIGENLAWGTYGLATPAAIVSAWIASPGHLANILESQYSETGIGITPHVPASLSNGAPGATYAQEFGVIVH